MNRFPEMNRLSCRLFTRLVNVVVMAFLVASAVGAQAHADGPTVTTDKLDYFPGDTAQITGSGFTAGDEGCWIELQVLHLNHDEVPCGCDGDGHEPWQVFSTDGTFTTTWFVNPDDSVGAAFILTAKNMTYPPEQATAFFTDALPVDFRQGANDHSMSTLGDIRWLGSILQANNSVYYEGMSVPQRTIITSIPATNGDVHTLTFAHQFNKGGTKAYDFLTSYAQAKQTMAAALGVAVNFNECGPDIGPPASLAGTCAALHAGVHFVDIDLPDDPFVSIDGPVQDRICAYENAYGNRTIRLYSNAPISDASIQLCHTVANGGDGSDSDVGYLLTWTSTGDQIVLEMAGHLAEGSSSLVCPITMASGGWGPGKGASSISGGPYHFKLGQLGGASVNLGACPPQLTGNEVESLGNMDNQIQGADILVAGACCIPDQDGVTSCMILPEEDCEDAGGSYQGDNTFCTPDPCPGACCLADGTCVPDLSRDECEEYPGAVFVGPGSSCDTSPCVPPQGCEILCPPDMTVECGASTHPDATGYAQCTELLIGCGCVASWTDVFTPDCGETGVITRTWTCACPGGLADTCVQTITIIDTLPPVLKNCPEDQYLGCNPTFIPQCSTNVSAVDICDPEVEVTCTYVDDVDGCLWSRTFIYSAIDSCGNAATCERVVTWIEDYDAPVLYGCPTESIWLTCDEEIPEPAEVTAFDECDGEIPVTFDQQESVDGCVIIITRTWTATDECYNTNTCFQVITIADLKGPEITCPGDGTVECPNVPVFGEPSVYDACDPNPTVTYVDELTPGDCPQEYSVTRTWTATDACGNSSSCTQTISVKDTTIPDIICAGPDKIDCPGTPVFPDPAVYDECDPNPALTYVDELTPGDCPQEYSVTRTWTVTDACGNTNTCSQTIFVVDRTAPVIICAGDDNVECPNVPVFGQPSVYDECDSAPTVTYVDELIPGDCPQEYAITRTWTATDACGNTNFCTQTISVKDSTKPDIWCPGDGTVECPDLPVFGEPSVYDECDPDPTVTFVDALIPGDCPQEYAVTRTWTVTDACGNSNFCSQTISVKDSTVPEIWCPGDGTVECPNDPVFGDPSVYDTCDPDPTVTFVDELIPGDCPQEYSVTRTWTVTDACGNSNFCTQTISVRDMTKPEIICAAVDKIDCPDTPVFPYPTVYDACDPDPTVTFVDELHPGDCPQEYSVTRTWTVTDACGNSNFCSQTIFVKDTTKPEISCGGPIKVECPDTPVFEDPFVYDACDPNPILTWVDELTPGSCPQEYTITRTWTVTDACGNSESCSQTAYVKDETAPSITCGPSHSIECPATPVFDAPSVDDLCDPNPVVTYVDSTTPGNCPQSYSVTRTWTATDACGNSATCAQTITVVDSTPPAIDCPPNGTVECPGTPVFGSPTVSDLCDPNPVVTYTDSITPGSCPQEYTVTRTWTATDACGNAANCSQSISVVDETAPEISCVDYIKIDCSETPVFPPPTYADACDPDPTLTYSDVVYPGSCPQEYSIVRTWTVIDHCGNANSCSTTLFVEDDTAPTITCGGPIKVECPDTPVFDPPIVIDTCDPDPTVSHVDTIFPGDCPQEYVVIRTWTATDACGNAASCSQTAFVEDKTGPVINCPDDIVVDLGSSGDCCAEVWFEVSATDACDPSPVLSCDAISGGTFCLGTTVVSCSAIDACGNESTCSFTITVTAQLTGVKFHDANLNGVRDPGEPGIPDWEITLDGPNGLVSTLTGPGGVYSFDIDAQGSYTCAEVLVDGWAATTPTSFNFDAGTDSCGWTFNFGNVCLGGGGGHTRGFWAGPNGEAAMNDGGSVAEELAMLSALCIVDADGNHVDLSTYAEFDAWIGSANAMNMAYMLSAQLAAMALNVEIGFVDPNAHVYTGGCGGLPDFVTVSELMALADAALCADGYTPAGDPNRAEQDCLKNALDAANNNDSFVQAQSCMNTCNLECPADFSFSGAVDGRDLGILLGAWGTSNPCVDLDGSGIVDGGDLGMLLAQWGPCPGED